MKTTIGIFLTSLFFLTGCSSASLISVQPKGAYASTSVSDGQIIDLNPVSEEDIRSYYSSLNSLSAEERSGTNLLKNLKPILSNNQKYYSYDSGSSNNPNPLWKMYEITDRDWDLSPASELSTYDASTNTIKGYTYSSSNPSLHVLYIDRNVPNQVISGSAYHSTGSWDYNREHIWMKSYGMQESTSPVSAGAGGRGDPHHLWPSAGIINIATHNDAVYGYVVDSARVDKDPENNPQYNGNYRGASRTLGGTKDVFEPQDSDKGDIARALFYMAARYNSYAGADSDEFNINNPNLFLSDVVAPSAGYSTSTDAFTVGILHDLLEWNRLDPPDEFEIHRNDLVYLNYTNNRNPFIDFPSWAEDIWGKAVEGTLDYESTGKAASPLNDTISAFSAEVTPSIEVSSSSLSVTSGSSLAVSATNNVSGSMSWSVADPSIATLSASSSSSGEEITVTGVAPGTTTVTVSLTVDKVVYSAEIEVKVVSEKKDTLTKETTVSAGAGGSYKDWTYDSPVLGNTYVGNTIAAVDYIQMRSDNSNSGIVISKSSCNIHQIDIEFNAKTAEGRVLNVYGSNTAYTSPADLYSENTQGTLLGSITYTAGSPMGSLLLDTDYSYIGIRSKSGALYLTSVSFTPGEAAEEEPVATSITATCEREFRPGDTISKEDIAVKDNLGNVLVDYEFTGEGYLFTYEDTLENGVGSVKKFTVSSGDLLTEVEVNVKRNVYVAPEGGELVIDSTFLSGHGIPASSSTSGNGTFTDSTTGVSFAYVGTYLYTSSGSTYLSFGKSNAGEFHNTSPLSSPISAVALSYRLGSPEGNTRVSKDGTTYVLVSEADLAGESYYYFKVDYEGIEVSAYTNISSITLSLRGKESLVNLVNYLMESDTEGQCEGKLAKALQIYDSLSATEQNEFDSSLDYCVSKARERLSAWKVAPKGGTSLQGFSSLPSLDYLPIVLVVGCFLLGIGGYCFLQISTKKRH